ncbi:MAG: class I SAM-dependent methyltransferase [Rhodospirillaceae bacterium]|nr:class I SAM-dependent methyltransferase [Rhodospirillaceae bacterium]
MTDKKLLSKAYQLSTPDDARTLYDEWAVTYDDELVSGNEYVAPVRMADTFAKYCGDKAARIIDIGCGTGLGGEALAGLGYSQIDGLDLSPGMLEVAGGKGVYGALIEADMTKSIAVEDATYDACVSVGAFTHSHIGPSGLDQVMRITRPGAIISLLVNAEAYRDDGYQAKFDEIEASGQAAMLLNEEVDYIIATGTRGRNVVLRRGG